MKNTKRLFATVLAVLMALCLCVPAMATSTKDGKITISNAETGAEYTLYKLFDATVNGNGGTSYTATKAQKTFYTSKEGNPFTFTAKSSDPYYVTVTSGKESNVTSFLQGFYTKSGTATSASLDGNFSKVVTKIGETKTATSKTVEFTGLDYGYYYITSSVGSVVTIDSANKEATVYDKNVNPKVEKEVSSNTGKNRTYAADTTAGFGDTVYFQTTITAGYNPTSYVLHDVLPSGLTLDSAPTPEEGKTTHSNFTVQVKKGTAEDYTTLTENTDYTISTTGSETDENATKCSFEIRFTLSSNTLKGLTNDDTILVKYQAKVNSDATIDGGGNINRTWLAYTQEGSSTGITTAEATATTYVFDVDIFKCHKGNNQSGNSSSSSSGSSSSSTTGPEPLSGAKFILYRLQSDNSTKEYAVTTPDTTTTNKYTLGGTVTERSTRTYWTTTEAKATRMTSGSDGKIYIDGLDAGTYYLEETEAPDGYNLLTAAVEFEIKGETTTTSGEGESATTKTTWGDVYTKVGGATTASKVDQIEIENDSGTELPSTGGMGTTIFYVVGGVLAVGAAVLLITKKRMKDED